MSRAEKYISHLESVAGPKIREDYPERFIATPEDKINLLLAQIPDISIAQAGLLYHAVNLGAYNLDNFPDNKKLNQAIAFAIMRDHVEKFQTDKYNYNRYGRARLIVGTPGQGDAVAQALENSVCRSIAITMEEALAGNPEGMRALVIAPNLSERQTLVEYCYDLQKRGTNIIGVGVGLAEREITKVDDFCVTTSITQKQVSEAAKILT